MGIDEMGVDEMGVDEMGSRRSGNKPLIVIRSSSEFASNASGHHVSVISGKHEVP